MMKNKKRNFLLIWILALALLLNVLAFVPVVADREPGNLADANVEGVTYEVTYTATVKEGDSTNEIEIDEGTEIPAEGFQSLNVDVNFNIPDNFELLKGDYFEIDLSGLSKIVNLPIAEEGSIVFEIEDTGGNLTESIDAAKYSVTAGPLLKVEFDQNLEKLNNKTDRLGFVGLLFTAEGNGEQLREKIEVPVSKTETRTFFVKKTVEGISAISKRVDKYVEGKGEIVWIIDVNTVLDSITGAYIVDSLPAGHSVKQVQLVDLKETGGIFSEDGDPESLTEKTGGSEGYTIDEEEDQNKLTVPLGDLNHEAKRVIITTEFQDGKGSSSHVNTAKLFGKDENQVGEDATAFINAGITGLSKTSASSDSPNEIVWEIKYIGDGTTTEITDTLTLASHDGDSDLKFISLFFDEASVKVNGAKFPFNGEGESVIVSRTDSTGELKIVFSGLPNDAGTPYTITYSTHSFFSGIGTKNYTVSNKAVHDTYGKAESSEDFSKNAVIEKEFAQVRQDEKDGELRTYIDWTIKINPNSEVWKNVVIKETIPKGFKFIEAKRGSKDLETGSAVVNEDGTQSIHITVVSGDNILNGSATITVTTELTDPGLEADEEGNIGYNIAQIKWNLDGDGYGEGNGIGDGPGFDGDNGGGDNYTIKAPIKKEKLDHKLTKTAVSKSIEPSGNTGKASWELDYKTYTSSIPFDLVIKDSIDLDKDYHTYDPKSFELVINGSSTISLDATEEDFKTWPYDDSGSTLFSYKLSIDDDKDFTLTIVPGTNNDSGNVYSSLFNQDANHIVLTYDTIVDFTKLKDVKNNVLMNDASVKIDQLNDLTASASQSFTEPFSLNGVKSVTSSNDGRTYTWTAKLNYKSKTISDDKTIIDTLSPGQIYDESSLNIYEAQLTTGYDLEKVKVDGNEVPLGSDDYTVSFTPESNNPTKMEIKFKHDLDHPIIIEYQTKAVGIAKAKYNNELKYNDMKYSKSVTRDNHNEFIDKELLNGRGTNGNLVVLGDVLDWEIDVNKSLSEIHNFVLTDTPSEGLILLPDSIKVIDKSNDDVTEDFGLEITDNGFTLSKTLVDERYTVKYSTLVVGSTGINAVSNEVNIEGDNLEEKSFETGDYRIVSASEAGGSGIARDDEFKLKIQKVFVGGDPGVLEAEFNLIIETTISEDPLETKTIEIPFTTDDEGQYTTIIKKNDYSKYYIQETGAPDGYLLSEDIFEINFNNAVSKVITINVVNIQKTQVTVEKEWIRGDSNIQSVEVQLLRDDQTLNDTTYTVELNEDNNWTYTWEDLEATDSKGNAYIYTVEEVDDLEYFESSVAGPREGDEPNSFVITNTYQASGEWSPKVTKRLDGRRLKNKEFEFELELQKQQPAPSSAVVPMSLDDPATSTEHVSVDDINDPLKETNNASGAVAFGPITFNENHIGKTFEFIIREGKPSFPEGGMRYDENEYKVVVEVKDAGDGKLNFITTYYQRGTPDQEWVDLEVDANKGITFRNIYSAGNAWTPNVTKELVGRELKDKEFEFVLKGPQGNVIEKVKNDADGNVVFSSIGFSEADIGGSYTYTIEEVVGSEPGMSYDTRSIKINVSISDARGGVLNINASYPAVTTFVNRYSGPSGITVTANKVWKDLPSGWTTDLPTIWFKLYRSVEGKTAEAVPGLALQKLPAGVTQVSWNGLEKYDPDGKLYVYSVKEVDENGKDYEPKYFEKTENGLTVTNAFIKERVDGDEDFETEIDVTGHKVWKGVPKGQTVPTIWLKLYRHIEGGTPVAVPGRPIMELRPGVTQGTWKDLEKVDEDYNYYIYSVKEVDNKGKDYEPPHFRKTEEGLTVTNTHTAGAPVTGETLSVYTIMGAMLMALAALFLILTGRKRAKAK
jgi:pilin isopeptide linkage protein